ncbi:MAG: carbohydrate porin [Limnohabitans sp.]
MPAFNVFRLTVACALLGLVSAAGAQEQEDTSARYQSTYNWQQHPGFGSTGTTTANSLSAQREKMYTFSLTGHWGLRLESGAAVYMNAELASGVPFTNSLVGLGSFTNGEITRAAGTTPKPYLQRLFWRKTWNQGGEKEQIASDFNQMAQVVDQNRFVMTAGNFSTLDVLDDNAYAKDPRTQFMNWSHWTYGAYDYAADARGFGWGVAGEWYQGDWVFRAARMTGPIKPNELQVDTDLLHHYGDQVEVEHAHTWMNQPGKLRVLAWRNRAVMASFKDATAYLLSHPDGDRQAFFKVRQGEKIKYGLGVNLEQALSDQVGFFLRAMKADGRTETYAFTEIDASLSAGVLVNGSAWQRGQDRFGLAWMENRLSRDRREFLAAGGVSYFIGDGQLQYKPERGLETFYSWGIHRHLWLTADYQHIQNPAYNALRGPVNVYAVRMHAEF